MTLIARLRRNLNIIGAQNSLIVAQRSIIEAKKAEINQVKLAHFREVQGMVTAWLISIEQPELDMRDELAELESDLGMQIAKLEEHIL